MIKRPKDTLSKVVPTICVLIVPLSVTYMSLSLIGSMSSMYCINLLLITTPTPAVYSGLPCSPLKNHVYFPLVSLLFCPILVSAIPIMNILFSVIHSSTSSLSPIFFAPLMLINAMNSVWPILNLLYLLGS